jgi:hypothetical protein
MNGSLLHVTMVTTTVGVGNKLDWKAICHSYKIVKKKVP